MNMGSVRQSMFGQNILDRMPKALRVREVVRRREANSFACP